MTNQEAIEDTKVWVIHNGDYSVVEVYKEDIGLFTRFFETKEEAEEYATFLKKNEVARAKAEEEIKGKMSSKEAVKVIKNIVETMDDYAFYTIEDKEAFRLAIKALEREEGWISAKDRLPEEDDEYLLYGHAYSDEDNNIFIGRFDDGQFGFWNMTCLGTDEFVPFASVLAWQPLPKPYEEETE